MPSSPKKPNAPVGSSWHQDMDFYKTFQSSLESLKVQKPSKILAPSPAADSPGPTGCTTAVPAGQPVEVGSGPSPALGVPPTNPEKSCSHDFKEDHTTELPEKRLTPSQWRSLPDKGKWDIQVALRGPDSYYGEALKWYTTGVIRGHVRNVMRVGGTVNTDLRLVVCPLDRTGKKVTDSWNAGHFLDHIIAAATWLGLPVLYIPTQRWHEIMQGNHSSTAGKEILEEARRLGETSQKPLINELRRHLKVWSVG